MLTKEQLIERRQTLVGQLNEAATGVENAKAAFNAVRGALLSLDLLIAEYDKKDEPAPKKPAKKGKK